MAPVSTNDKKDIKWTDAQIRWPEDEVAREGTDETNSNDGDGDGDNSDEDDNENLFDPFADPDPHEIFSFRFVTKKKSALDNDDDDDDDEENGSAIRLDIHGYKTESDAVWQSTGLTLWKASKYLCDYMVQHADELQGQRVLEVSEL